ncbi:hypothetical protein D3C80_2041430 [compost metagenome]
MAKEDLLPHFHRLRQRHDDAGQILLLRLGRGLGFGGLGNPAIKLFGRFCHHHYGHEPMILAA